MTKAINPHRHARCAFVCIGLIVLVSAANGCQTSTCARQNDQPPTRVAIVIAEPQYQTSTTLPALAEKAWTQERGYAVTIVQGDPTAHDMPGLIDALKDADVLVLSVRRQALPEAQLQAIRDHLDSGKPLLAIRTSSHAFALRNNSREQPTTMEGRAQWPAFDAEVLGGNYHGHYPNGEPSVATATPGQQDHPILRGIELPLLSNAGIYKNNPLADTAVPLLTAKPTEADRPAHPVAWTHRFGDAKVFYTSLGNVDDFKQPGFVRLIDQAMQWLCE